MRVLIIGSGLAGIPAAWFLRKAGCEVTVLDSASAPAAETSHANGSMLTPSLADPWNAPGVLGTLLRSLGREDSPMLLRPKALPSLIGWGLDFLRHATRERFEASYLANIRFARYSQSVMRDLLQADPLSFDFAPDGTIKAFRDDAALAAGKTTAAWLEERAGIRHRVLDQAALLEMEPALAATIDGFTGGIHYVDDEVGNARRFCEALAARALEEGVRFCYDTTVTGFERSPDGAVTAVRTDDTTMERLDCDALVLAAGSWSWPLARTLGLNLPVRPAKGYSITVPTAGITPMPRYAIIDEALHAAVVPLGGTHLRVAGTAEFAGFDRTLTGGRIDNLRHLLEQVYPHVPTPIDTISPWCGFRPMSSDGRALVGATRLPNVYLNTGHGVLGWTLACGSGQSIAELVTGETPTFALDDVSPARYGL